MLGFPGLNEVTDEAEGHRILLRETVTLGIMRGRELNSTKAE